MKKSLSNMKIAGFVAVVSLAMLAGAAYADAPVVAITGITGPDVVSFTGGTLTVSAIPTGVSVNGTVTHDPNLNPVQSVKLYVNNVLTSTQAIPNGSGDTYNFALPWTITAAASYQLKITAKHGNCANCTGSDTEDVLVVLDLGGGGGPGPGVDCKAAPAVANELLKAAGIKNNSKTSPNYISQVAHQMGPQTNFNSVAACDVSNYKTAVKNYLNSILPSPVL